MDFNQYRKPEPPSGQKGNTDSESSEKEDTNCLPSDFFTTCTNEYFIRRETEKHEALLRDWKKKNPECKPIQLTSQEVQFETSLLATLRSVGDGIWDELDFSKYNPVSVFKASF